MPAETGVPPYVSKDNKTGMYQYYRRPSKGVVGKAFVRAFGSRDKKVVASKYGAIHAEAEAYFTRLQNGRSMPEDEINHVARGVLFASFSAKRHPGVIPSATDLRRDWDSSLSLWEPEITNPADIDAIYQRATVLLQEHEAAYIDHSRKELDQHAIALRAVAPQTVIKSAFTLRDAFDQAWVHAKNSRGKNTVVEVGRYVDEFEALNGKLDLSEYTRAHWAAWRKDCLDRHGANMTAFKFSMMKTVVKESIRAGLFFRKDFAGEDVTLRKPKRSTLRNEGWRPNELKQWFNAPVFKGVKDGPHPDADYWSAVLIAYTGAAIIEVSNINTADVAQRHGYWTLRLWRRKSDHSDRIIPISKQMIDLGFLRYVESRPKNGPLFAKADGKRVSNKDMSQRFSRMRAEIGITRKGATAHTYRHHIKTVLADLGAPERVNDYITGHAPPNVGRTYGKVEFQTALRYLDQVDLGVKIPKWKAA